MTSGSGDRWCGSIGNWPYISMGSGSGNLIIALFNIPREESFLIPLSKTMKNTLDSFGKSRKRTQIAESRTGRPSTFVLEILDAVSRITVA